MPVVHLFGGANKDASNEWASRTLDELLATALPNKDRNLLELLFRCEDTSLPVKVKLSYSEAMAISIRLGEKVRLACSSLPEGSVVGLELQVPAHIILAELGLLFQAIPFCPLNPTDAEARRATLKAAVNVAFTVDDAQVRSWIEEALMEQHLGCGSNTRDPAADDAVAYYIFTSGTTGGAPKAVKVLRRQIALYGTCFGNRFVTEGCGPIKILFASSATFDPSIGDLIIALSFGGTVVASGGLLKGFHEQPASLASVLPYVTAWASTTTITADITFLVQHSGFTHLTSTPVVVSAISDSAREGIATALGTKPTMCLGGEPMQPSLAGKWAPYAKLHNIYGVTEAVIYQNATLLDPSNESDFSSLVRTLGRPLDPRCCWCAVDTDAIEPDSTVASTSRLGELILLGPMVAAGYQRESSAFFTYTCPATGRQWPAYRTGDVVEVTFNESNGDPSSVVFVGRKDFQIKINGKRTSLEEVEALIKVAMARCFTSSSAEGTVGSYFGSADPWLENFGTEESEKVGNKRGGVDSKRSTPNNEAQCTTSGPSIKGCSVAAISATDLDFSSDNDGKVLICYLCFEVSATVAEALLPCLLEYSLSPSSIRLTSSVVRALLVHSGLLAAHMVPKYTVIDVKVNGSLQPQADGTAFMTANGKTDRAGLTRYMMTVIQRGLARAGEDEITTATVDELATALVAMLPEQSSSVRLAKEVLKVVIEVWTVTLGVGLQLKPSSSFLESGGDSLQAARFMGRLVRRLAAEGYLTAEGISEGVGDGILPKGFEAALLLAPSASLQSLAHRVLEAIAFHMSGDEYREDVDVKQPSAITPAIGMGGQASSSARVAAMSAASSSNPHADLIVACVKAGELMLADILVSSGAVSLKGRVEVRGATSTVLHTATRLGNPAMANLLMHHGARLTDINGERSTPMFVAVDAGQLAMLRMFVERSAGMYNAVRDGRGQSLLHAAARAGGTDMVNLALTALQLDPEARDQWQRTPLHWAIINNNLEALSALLAFFDAHGGVNPNRQAQKHSSTRNACAFDKEHWRKLASKHTSKPYQTLLEVFDLSPLADQLELRSRLSSLSFV